MAASDPITGVANAVTTVIGGLVTPFVEKHLAQEYLNEHLETIKLWNNAQAIDEPRARADASWAVLMRLLNSCGSTAIGAGTNVSVPSDVLAALVERTSKSLMDEKLVQRFQYNLSK